MNHRYQTIEQGDLSHVAMMKRGGKVPGPRPKAHFQIDLLFVDGDHSYEGVLTI